MVADIHIQTLNPEGQTSSQGPYGDTIFYWNYDFFQKSFESYSIVDHKT